MRVHELQQLLDNSVRRTVDELGLTLAQANALRHLGSPLTTRELSDRIVCEPSNTTFVAGYIVRRPHPTDRRMRYLALTPSGSRLRRVLLERIRSNDPLPGLSDDELTALESHLDQALASSGSAGSDGSDGSAGAVG